jgi:transcriptional regulator with XRE-family HTH domain
MDLVLKLREIRRLRGLSQKDVAQLSGVGEKTISSFETGQRIGSLKLDQLKKLLSVYGLSEAEFFGCSVERQIAPWELEDEENAAQRLIDDLRGLPKAVQKVMLGKFQLMLETASEVNTIRDKRPAYIRDNPGWHMPTSRNGDAVRPPTQFRCRAGGDARPPSLRCDARVTVRSCGCRTRSLRRRRASARPAGRPAIPRRPSGQTRGGARTQERA